MRVILITASVFLSFVASSFGTTYTWTDENGTMSLTDDYGKIPKKFRKKAKALGQEEPEVSVTPIATGAKEATPAAKDEGKAAPVADEKKNMQFGGKAGSVWKEQFGKLKADLKAAEEQVGDLRRRLADTGKLSRSEYLSIQYTIKNVENTIAELKTKRDTLTDAANKAKVPEEFR